MPTSTSAKSRSYNANRSRVSAPSNPPGFDAEVIGMTPGSSKSFTITYPEDYTVPELAGGKVDYTVNLKEIKKRVIPALDD